MKRLTNEKKMQKLNEKKINENQNEKKMHSNRQRKMKWTNGLHQNRLQLLRNISSIEKVMWLHGKKIQNN